MSITLKRVACINCNLLTREDRVICQNTRGGEHRRDIRIPQAQPSEADREAFFLWLSQSGVKEVAH